MYSTITDYVRQTGTVRQMNDTLLVKFMSVSYLPFIFMIKFPTARAKARKEKMENGSVQPPPDLAVPRVHCFYYVQPPPGIAEPRVQYIIMNNSLQI